MGAKVVNVMGKRYGRLTVVAYGGIFGKAGRKFAMWHCKCVCGNETMVRVGSLRSGKTRSCGCLQDETRKAVNTKHGYTGTPTYRSWAHMKARCLNPKDKDFKHYGGRGISLCKRWEQFKNFLEDMGEKPKTLSIERENNELGYFKENCRYATQKEQTRNMRRNWVVNYQGKRMCVADWAKETGLQVSTLAYRLKHYPPEIAFTM